MEKVTSKKKKRFRKNTFKFADCVSMMDVLKTDTESIGLFFFMTNKVMEVRSHEATCFKH